MGSGASRTPGQQGATTTATATTTSVQDGDKLVKGASGGARNPSSASESSTRSSDRSPARSIRGGLSQTQEAGGGPITPVKTAALAKGGKELFRDSPPDSAVSKDKANTVQQQQQQQRYRNTIPDLSADPGTPQPMRSPLVQRQILSPDLPNRSPALKLGQYEHHRRRSSDETFQQPPQDDINNSNTSSTRTPNRSTAQQPSSSSSQPQQRRGRSGSTGGKEDPQNRRLPNNNSSGDYSALGAEAGANRQRLPSHSPNAGGDDTYATSTNNNNNLSRKRPAHAGLRANSDPDATTELNTSEARRQPASTSVSPQTTKAARNSSKGGGNSSKQNGMPKRPELVRNVSSDDSEDDRPSPARSPATYQGGGGGRSPGVKGKTGLTEAEILAQKKAMAFQAQSQAFLEDDDDEEDDLQDWLDHTNNATCNTTEVYDWFAGEDPKATNKKSHNKGQPSKGGGPKRKDGSDDDDDDEDAQAIDSDDDFLTSKVSPSTQGGKNNTTGKASATGPSAVRKIMDDSMVGSDDSDDDEDGDPEDDEIYDFCADEEAPVQPMPGVKTGTTTNSNASKIAPAKAEAKSPCLTPNTMDRPAMAKVQDPGMRKKIDNILGGSDDSDDDDEDDDLEDGEVYDFCADDGDLGQAPKPKHGAGAKDSRGNRGPGHGKSDRSAQSKAESKSPCPAPTADRARHEAFKQENLASRLSDNGNDVVKPFVDDDDDDDDEGSDDQADEVYDWCAAFDTGDGLVGATKDAKPKAITTKPAASSARPTDRQQPSPTYIAVAPSPSKLSPITPTYNNLAPRGVLTSGPGVSPIAGQDNKAGRSMSVSPLLGGSGPGAGGGLGPGGGGGLAPGIGAGPMSMSMYSQGQNKPVVLASRASSTPEQVASPGPRSQARPPAISTSGGSNPPLSQASGWVPLHVTTGSSSGSSGGSPLLRDPFTMSQAGVSPAFSDSQRMSPSKLSTSGRHSSLALGGGPKTHTPASRKAASEGWEDMSNPDETPTVKDTHDVSRKKAPLPEQTLHAKPTGGTWLKSRYIVNNYILLDSLGTGSYAEVRMGMDKETKKLFAIKIIKKEMMKKKGPTGKFNYDDIKAEIAIMKKLNHPNVLRLYEVMDDPKVNKLYLVLEYMKLGDLMHVLKGDSNNNCLPLPDYLVWSILRQVTRGLQYLHQQNVIHGDIKPQNLLVNVDGMVKIADFGISKILLGSDQKLLDTAGTPAFMCPELCSGVSYSGQLADVWALGATMYMVRCGHPPFIAGTVLQLYYKIQNDPLTFELEIDPGLKSLLEGMLVKDQAKRMTLQDVLNVPWLNTEVIITARDPTFDYLFVCTKYEGISNTIDDPLSRTLREVRGKQVMYDPITVSNDEIYKSVRELKGKQATRTETETNFEPVEEVSESQPCSPAMRPRSNKHSDRPTTASDRLVAGSASTARGLDDSQRLTGLHGLSSTVRGLDDSQRLNGGNRAMDVGINNNLSSTLKLDESRLEVGGTDKDMKWKQGGHSLGKASGSSLSPGPVRGADDLSLTSNDDTLQWKQQPPQAINVTSKSVIANAGPSPVPVRPTEEIVRGELTDKDFKWKQSNFGKLGGATGQQAARSSPTPEEDRMELTEKDLKWKQANFGKHQLGAGGGGAGLAQARAGSEDLVAELTDKDLKWKQANFGRKISGRRQILQASLEKEKEKEKKKEKRRKDEKKKKTKKLGKGKKKTQSLSKYAKPAEEEEEDSDSDDGSGSSTGSSSSNSGSSSDDASDSDLDAESGDIDEIMDTLAEQPGAALKHMTMPSMRWSVYLPQSGLHNVNLSTSACWHSVLGDRKNQEDRVTVIPDMSALGDALVRPYLFRHYCFLAVFDGHNGANCASYLQHNMHMALVRQPTFHTSIKEAVTAACVETDAEVCAKLIREEDNCGSTGLFALYDGRTETLLVANVGDSRCVLSRNGLAVEVSREHRPSRQDERERIEACGGLVQRQRVNGVLAVSRSFGDTQHKGMADTNNKGSPQQNVVIAVPEIICETINSSCEFIVMASDGLWDVLSSQQVVNLIRTRLPVHRSLEKVAKEVTAEALACGSVDNVSVIILAFHQKLSKDARG